MQFADVKTIRDLSGHDKVPILLDSDCVIHDSWNIATSSNTQLPGHPPLFGGDAGRGLTRTLGIWADTVLAAPICLMIVADFLYYLASEDRGYYRRSREVRFGCSLEAYCADRKRWLAEFATTIAPLGRTLAEQWYVAGIEPASRTT